MPQMLRIHSIHSSEQLHLLIKIDKNKTYKSTNTRNARCVSQRTHLMLLQLLA